MAYSTSSASTQTELILAIEAFCVANGWTVNLSAVLGSGRRLHVSKNGAYANFSTSSASYLIEMELSDGFNAGAAWNNQPTIRSGVTRCSLSIGSVNILPCTYHFFAHDDFVAAVFVSSGGTSDQLMFGNIAKVGTYTGGIFGGAGGAPMSTYTGTSQMIALGSTSVSEPSPSFGQAYALSDAVGEDSRFGASPLMPHNIFKNSSPYYDLLGTLPHVRACGRSYAQGEELTLGSDVWKVFYKVPTSYTCFAFKK